MADVSQPFRLSIGGVWAHLLPRSHSLVSRSTGNRVGLSRESSNLSLGAYTAERSSLSPSQLIAKASSAALELAETGDMEPALKVLTQLAKKWE